MREIVTGQKRPAQVSWEHQLAESLLLRCRKGYEERGEETFLPRQVSGTESSGSLA